MENIETAEKTIKEENLFKKGETIAVACSGGVDSIVLLHYLFSHKEEYGINIVAVNVDHSIRENSADDSKFVADFCKNLGITCYKFKVEELKISQDKKIGIEEAARLARYKVFESVVEKGLCDKVAIAHHESDQVETILLNIFRGAGLKGASGMEAKQGNFVRPFLNTPKSEILQYASENGLSHVEDQTNMDTTYSRNFLRNELLPSIRKHCKNVDTKILAFSKVCKKDDEFINSQIDFDDIEIENGNVKIPLYKFAYAESVQNRVLRYAFAKLNLSKDIEKRHLNILKSMVKDAENGSKISLPNKLRASLDYDYLTLSLPKFKTDFVPKDFKKGTTNFDKLSIFVKKTKDFSLNLENTHIIDAEKLPTDAKWRHRENGDIFAKFGSGEKKLKEYMIDKKIPNSEREEIPVLASGKEIFCVLGYEISDKVKVDENTKMAYVIKYKKIK